MTNVFLVHDERLLTPRLERCGVAGVMRRVVLQAAQRCRHCVRGVRAAARRTWPRRAELFLTNALIGIRPVRELDGRALSVGCTHPAAAGAAGAAARGDSGDFAAARAGDS